MNVQKYEGEIKLLTFRQLHSWTNTMKCLILTIVFWARYIFYQFQFSTLKFYSTIIHLICWTRISKSSEIIWSRQKLTASLGPSSLFFLKLVPSMFCQIVTLVSVVRLLPMTCSTTVRSRVNFSGKSSTSTTTRTRGHRESRMPVTQCNFVSLGVLTCDVFVTADPKMRYFTSNHKGLKLLYLCSPRCSCVIHSKY